MKIIRLFLAILAIGCLAVGPAMGQGGKKAGIPPGTTHADGSVHVAGDTLFWSDTYHRWISASPTAGGGKVDLTSEVTGLLPFGNLALANAPTPKTTPIDADGIVFGDSGASWAWKSCTWTNIKAFLKTYFDTLYLASGTPVTAPQGGTGQSSYAVGDMLYAPSTTTVGKLAAVATGHALVSAGINTAPTYSATPALTDLTLNRGVLTLVGETTPLVPATALVAGGSMTAGDHYAKIAYVTSDGKESMLSPVSTPVITTGGGNNSMSVTRNGGDSPSASVVSWNVYATKIGSNSSFYLVANVAIANPAYTITVADTSFGSAPTNELLDGTTSIIMKGTKLWYPYAAGAKTNYNLYVGTGYLYGNTTSNFLNPSMTSGPSLAVAGFIKYAGASRVTADFDFTAVGTTLTNITGLTSALVATSNYRFRAELWITSTGTPTDKWKVAIANSTAVTSIMYNVEYLLSAAVRNESVLQTASGSAVNCTSALVYDHIIITGFLKTNTAGNLTVQIAKQGAGTDTTLVLLGSNFFVDFIN